MTGTMPGGEDVSDRHRLCDAARCVSSRLPARSIHALPAPATVTADPAIVPIGLHVRLAAIGRVAIAVGVPHIAGANLAFSIDTGPGSIRHGTEVIAGATVDQVGVQVRLATIIRPAIAVGVPGVALKAATI